jgi:hypothetical protein
MFCVFKIVSQCPVFTYNLILQLVFLELKINYLKKNTMSKELKISLMNISNNKQGSKI